MEKNLNLSCDAISAIKALQHKNGTYHYYADTLSRLINLIFNQSDEIGMSDTEAMATLRTLHALRDDLNSISGIVAESQQTEASDEEISERVEETFSSDNTSHNTPDIPNPKTHASVVDKIKYYLRQIELTIE